MKLFREIINGLLWTVGCVLLVIGAFSLAFVEGTVRAQEPQPAEQTEIYNIPSEMPTPDVTKKASPTIPVMWTITKQVAPACTPPVDWVKYTIRSKDTLAKLSSEHNISVREIKDGNCLLQDKLVAGTIIYLPLLPTATPGLTETPVSTTCSVHPGWVPYTVRSGDSLFSISMATGISVWQLKTGNCLDQSDLILAGQILYVPNVIAPTNTMVSTPTKVKPTKIPTAIPPTATIVTETATEVITETITESPTPASETVIP